MDIRTRRVAAVINTAAGSSHEGMEERMRELFEEAGITDAKIYLATPGELIRAFEEAERGLPDVLVVCGGDGTIRAAAERSQVLGPILIPLPGGTMNLLPKALYGERTWEEALTATLENPMVRTISAGRVGSERFFIAAVFGAPTLWAKAREALREGDVGAALMEGQHALEHMFASTVRYHFNDLHEGTAEAVAVVCPLIATTLADDRQVLEAAVIDVKDAGEVLELATAAAFGEWRDARNVAVVNTKEVIISSDTQIPMILDGETVDGGTMVKVEFVGDGFRAMVPA